MTSEKKLTAAAQKLRECISPRYTQQEIAEKLGVKQQAISSWATGRTTPSAEYMAKLEDLLGIPMRAWTQEIAEPEPPAPGEPGDPGEGVTHAPAP